MRPTDGGHSMPEPPSNISFHATPTVNIADAKLLNVAGSYHHNSITNNTTYNYNPNESGGGCMAPFAHVLNLIVGRSLESSPAVCSRECNAYPRSRHFPTRFHL